jgi:methyltransferase (TIGR00027 family)
MNPVSDTAYFTCGARADDAAKAQPICGDRYAARFLAGPGEAIYDQFKEDSRTLSSIVVRHRMIDELLRERIAGNPDTAVVILGAGYDSRAFRLDGGRWIEIDETQVIERKNAILPAADCRNPLRRIVIDFATEALTDKLPPFSADTPVVVVMEGIFFYLSDEQRNTTFAALRQTYPRHTLICDLSSRGFMERYGKALTKRLDALGAKAGAMPDDPVANFIAAGYRREAQLSIIAAMLGFAGNWFSTMMAWFLPKTVRDGLALHVFRMTPIAHVAVETDSAQP